MKYGWLTLVLAVACGLSAVNVNAQTTNSSNQQQYGSGNLLNYPPGTRVYGNGTISTPRSGIISPTVAVPRGNGSTTYYYPNGTQITIDKNTINPTGTFISPGINGGIRDNRLTNPNNYLLNR
ncbi:hypothetical protein IQ264_23730 [Phormidium sp. LEGE 05292]|uniref:hypothetical protein n=1 Tax=[Phormidium] sp. LEGE 05292 TaxID=767427 RepID=UPI001881C6C9|nr:hypothetical protein [Phormidium sp. LEGE 05292]MBE9228435.1 hypothetical protein [Phormidium sp. LEGE 05292]